MISLKTFGKLALLGGFLALIGPVTSPEAQAGSTTAAVADQGVEQEVLLTLTLSGSEADVQRLTLADLKAMGVESFETETIWTTGVQQFTGVPLARLVEEFTLTDGILQARAVNDYMVEVPVSDAVEGGPMIAFERNGELMSLRSKGPLWLVYPYDHDPAYRNEVIYSRSIWQLDRLTVTP